MKNHDYLNLREFWSFGIVLGISVVSLEIQMNWLVGSSSCFCFCIYVVLSCLLELCSDKREKKRDKMKKKYRKMRKLKNKNCCVNNGVKKRIELEVLGVI